MKPGALDRRVTLQKSVESVDDMGAVVTTWEEIGKVWSERRNMKGKELVEATEIVSEAETKFTIRHSTDVNAVNTSDRILNGSQYFQILWLTPIPGHRPEKIEILTKYRGEVDADGNLRTTEDGTPRTTDGGVDRTRE